jgi:hypothetical protein
VTGTSPASRAGGLVSQLAIQANASRTVRIA